MISQTLNSVSHIKCSIFANNFSLNKMSGQFIKEFIFPLDTSQDKLGILKNINAEKFNNYHLNQSVDKIASNTCSNSNTQVPTYSNDIFLEFDHLPKPF